MVRLTGGVRGIAGEEAWLVRSGVRGVRCEVLLY